MRRVFIVAAALIAALPMAHATTYSYSIPTSSTATSPDVLYSTPGNYPITIWGYTYTSVTKNGNGDITAFSGGAQQSLSFDSYGMGVVSTCNEITVPGVCGTKAPGSYVVVDFADASPSSGPELNGAISATITIDNADSGWTIYGTNALPGSSGISGLQSLASKAGGVSTGNVYNQLVSLTGYAYLVITAGPTSCELNVKSISVSTPEPGTFVMAGMALIGLGMALRKARKG